MEKGVKQKVLARDNYSCRRCGSKDNLEVHHIISKEELNLIGAIDDEFIEYFDQPNFCITLCTECHSTTFFQSSRDRLYTIEEQSALRSIVEKSKKLSVSRKCLKKRYHNLWNTKSYQEQKYLLEKDFKELKKQKMEIVEKGRERLTSHRQQVVKVCEQHLLEVIKN